MIRKGLLLVFASLACAFANAQSQPDAEPRISRNGLKEEQRIISVHLREARKDLDRAKVDLNGNRTRTAEVVISRTEVSISKAGGLLEEHPVRIEKLKGLFISDAHREELREVFNELDDEYLNLEREFYTMVDEIGGGASRRSRMEFLKLISSAISELTVSDPKLGKQLEALLAEYEACLKAGDNDCATQKLKELRELYESRKSQIAEATGKQVSTENIISSTPQDWPGLIDKLASGQQAEALALMQATQAISNPDKRHEAEKLYSDYLYALQQGDTAKAAELRARIQELTGGSLPSNQAAAPAPRDDAPRVEVNNGRMTFIDANGRPIISADAATMRDGANNLPQVEYAGGIGKRITKEYDVIIDYNSADQSFSASQGNVKIWSLEVSEDPSQRILDTSLITSFELQDAGVVGDDYAVESWLMTDQSGNTIREGSGSSFRVEFTAPGTYRIIAVGRTLRGNDFEIGREYPIAEGILE